MVGLGRVEILYPGTLLPAGTRYHRSLGIYILMNILSSVSLSVFLHTCACEGYETVEIVVL